MNSSPRSSADRFKRAASSRVKDQTTGQAPERGATARRTKPVRITVDLTPEDYRLMRSLVTILAERADIPTLPHSRMWRALLHRVQDDPDLLAEVAALIKEEQE
ncbi:hypothetical protein [Streptosporangium saharense]|uniref:Uncharacterized protein n=1 Tax=Streptosporangium saharense TaxID=1706840 RepID=A0A7W7VST9_9ACTN|nr:hypothetical protein [Streptosporangium saharense]MBB4920984.1 hypothetical protein [Streptosporangium saharense]